MTGRELIDTTQANAAEAIARAHQAGSDVLDWPLSSVVGLVLAIGLFIWGCVWLADAINAERERNDR